MGNRQYESLILQLVIIFILILLFVAVNGSLKNSQKDVHTMRVGKFTLPKKLFPTASATPTVSSYTNAH